MEQFHLIRPSTLKPESDLCPFGIRCMRLHNFDVTNQGIRDIIQSTLDRVITDNDVINFENNSGVDVADQDQNILAVCAKMAASKVLEANVEGWVLKRLACRIVVLHDELCKSKMGDFCPSTLANALKSRSVPHQQVGLRRAQTMFNGRRPDHTDLYPDSASSYIESYIPSDGYCIELWIVVGAISFIAGGLLLFGKRPRFFLFS